VGSRTAAGCNPNDGYICSSKLVKELIVADCNNWIREILFISPRQPVEVINKEVEVLHELDAKNDPMSFNRHNGDGKFTSTGKDVSDFSKKKMSDSKKGIKFTSEHRTALSIANSKGYYCYNNIKYMSSIVAAREHKVSDFSIRNWSKHNKNGWTIELKDSN